MPKVDDKRKEYDVLGLETTANEGDYLRLPQLASYYALLLIAYLV